MGTKSLIAGWIASLTILGATIWGFWFFAPLTYGTPGLDIAGVNARKWLGYDLHFAK
jgi:dolichyl-phosphate-mannose-protein mannosyltransferase